MIVKTFSKQTTGLSGKSARNNRGRLRQEAVVCINKDIKSEKNILNITESAGLWQSQFGTALKDKHKDEKRI